MIKKEKIYSLFLILISTVTLLSCSDNKKYETAICALADISGTYAKEKSSMVKIIKAGILPKLLPGDSLFLITINSRSYDEKNIKAKIKLDYRPSQANEQRLDFSKKLDKFVLDKEKSRYTDISGAMMLCSGQLKNTQAGNQVIFIFSDMKEELKPGLKRNFSKDEFKNMNISAINVIKLSEDNNNPKIYRSRIKKWETRVLDHGAESWNGNLEPENITEYIENLR